MRKNGFLLVLPLILALAVITGCPKKPGPGPDPDGKVELTAVTHTGVTAEATSTVAKFSGATALEATLENTDFEVVGSTSAVSPSISNITISGDNVEITLAFTANNTNASRTITVKIDSESTTIKGSTEVVITQAAADTRVALESEGQDEFFAEADDTETVVLYKGATANMAVPEGSFTVEPATAISASATADAEGVIEVTVSHGANTGIERTFTVNINSASEVFKGDAPITITQYDPNDARERLTPEETEYDVADTATTATVKYNSVATGLALTEADFTISGPGNPTVENVTVTGTVIEVEVAFKANLTNDVVSYNVSVINETIVRPGSVIVIKQDAIFYLQRVYRYLDFEVHRTLGPGADMSGNEYWTSNSGNRTGAHWAQSGNLARDNWANPLKVGNISERVFRLSDGSDNNRASQFVFKEKGTDETNWLINGPKGTIHGIAFDWYPGQHTNSSVIGSTTVPKRAGYIGIQDSDAGYWNDSGTSTWANQLISFFAGNTAGDMGVSYLTGNCQPATNDDEVVNDVSLTAAIPTGIAKADLNKWYRFKILIDFGPAKMIYLTITDLDTGNLIQDNLAIPFATTFGSEPLVYNNRIESFRVLGSGGGGAGEPGRWTTYLDNFELLRQAAAPVSPGTADVKITFATEANMGVTGWDSSLTLSNSTGTTQAAITVGNFATADWYLNGSATPVYQGKTYTLDATNANEGAKLRFGPNFLTVVVKVDGVEYSSKLNFTVVN